MQKYISKVRVTYSDTDQMGYVHHNNYLKYYETARWELLEHIGIPYKEIEKKGYMLPVTRLHLKFVKPAFYDDELVIETEVKSLSGSKICFRYRLLNEAGQLVNKAEVTLAFIRKDTRLPCQPPAFVLEKIMPAVLMYEPEFM